MADTWLDKSLRIRSKGSVVKKASSLGDLHRQRKETQSQYFTPAHVSNNIWHVLTPLLDTLPAHVTPDVLDPCVGSGMMLHGAPAAVHAVGCDPDARCIEALNLDAQAANLDHEFAVSGMENLKARDFHLSLLNPPFSLHLSSPNLQPYEFTSYGKYGPNTSAISHHYALELALDSASVTVAILPDSMEDYCRSVRTLRAIYRLPKDTFKDENAIVNTSVYFFWKSHSPQHQVHTHSVCAAQLWPALPCTTPLWKNKRSSHSYTGINTHRDIITTPFTGDNTVTLNHHNRKIILSYQCAYTQSSVENGIRVSEAEGEKLPTNLKYKGDGKLLLDVLLLQDEPHQQLDRLCHEIRTHGGQPIISSTLAGYYRKLVNRHLRATVPLRRIAKTTGNVEFEVTAKSRGFMIPGDTKSPVVKTGQTFTARNTETGYQVRSGAAEVTIDKSVFDQRFTLTKEQPSADWSVIHPGLCSAFPALAVHYEQKWKSLGLEWLAKFQKNTMIEGCINPYGYIAGLAMGAGKSRISVALCLMHSGTNMLVVESGLIPEMIAEFRTLGLADTVWKHLKTGDMPSAKINLVSYQTLKKGTRITVDKTIFRRGESETIKVTKIVRTNATQWKRRINLLICDEGGLLANINTQQSKAIKSLAARKVVIMDGTPLRSYPRDLLHLLVATAGNGLAHQQYGTKGRSYITKTLIHSTSYAQRGEAVFMEKHITLEWVTNEFKDTLSSDTGGARREIPKIKNLSQYREWISPHIQRRVSTEPELAKFHRYPTPTRKTNVIDWDNDHLNYYLLVALEFAQWYKKASGLDGKSLSLVTVLQRIGAVIRAASVPHASGKNTRYTYEPYTSKQRALVDCIHHHVGKKRKTIVYSSSPLLLERIQHMVNCPSLLFTGKQNIKKRTDELEQFKNGPIDLLLSSWVGQRGLNLPKASTVLLYNRAWSSSIEEQAIARTLRPSQRQQVRIEYFHLAGSIDEYMAQLVEFKRSAADAGLDFGEQIADECTFLHLDTILHRFCDDVFAMTAQGTKDILSGDFQKNGKHLEPHIFR